MDEVVTREPTLDEVFRKHSAALRAHIAAEYERSGADCDQIESGAWDRARRHWATADREPVGNPLGWLKQAAKFEYLSLTRKRHHRHERQTQAASSDAPPDPSAGSAFDPMKQAARKDRDALLSAELDGLTEYDRLLIALRNDDKLEWPQVAYVLWNDAGHAEAVRKQHTRLMHKLLARIRARHGGQPFGSVSSPAPLDTSDGSSVAQDSARSAGEGVIYS